MPAPTKASGNKKRKNCRIKKTYSNSFLKLVETHHYKERDISFYAEKLCLTPKYLSSIIRDVSGELAGNWIDNYVIIEAKALLISSNLTIQEICYKLNFSTPSSFTRFFKRITGMSTKKIQNTKSFSQLNRIKTYNILPPALIFMNEDKYFSHLARSLFELQISYASIFLFLCSHNEKEL